MRETSWTMCTLALCACGDALDSGSRPIQVAADWGSLSECATVLGGDFEGSLEQRALWQLQEFRISFVIQETQVLLRPVMEQPKGPEWHQDLEHAQIDGRVISQGENWTLLHMIAVPDPDWTGALYLFSAEIEVTPFHTSFDFGDTFVEYRRHLMRIDDLVRGCDSESGLSFQAGALIDGLPSERRCFPAPTTTDPDSLTWFDLQCAQAIERATYTY